VSPVTDPVKREVAETVERLADEGSRGGGAGKVKPVDAGVFERRPAMSRIGLAGAALLVVGCAGMTAPADNTAWAELRRADGEVVGTATFTQIGSALRVLLEVQGLPPGAKGVHVHAVGTCEGPAFTSAGAHFNPDGRQHGALNHPLGPHAGDLPNITLGADGRGRLESTTELMSLGSGPSSVFDADGSAIIVHAAPDDFRTDPTGNSGARIACGVIVRR
jgi:Cu-Zn family superoxide dismutase